MEIIERPVYLQHIVSRLNRGMIVILVGQRRVGKSYMLRQLRGWLDENRPQANVVYISKELQEFSSVVTARDLYDYVSPRLTPGAENYLLIDEVQDIEDYENALRSLQAEERCQIVATGSNAYVFSSELSTRLAGRYIEVPVYSLSYNEFLEFHGLADSDDSLLAYMRVGGLPGLCHFDISDASQVRDYLQGVFSPIMMRDVIARESIRNVPFIMNLSRFIADNIGKLISVSSIVKFMKSQGDKVSDPMTSAYISYLCNALILRRVERYDIHGKRLFESISKYYFSDHGLRNLICGFNLRGSVEKIIENVIYHHLRVQGFEVTVGILRAGEVDFIATKGSQTVYVQATYLLESAETVEREFGNLMAIKDNYPKYVVSMDPVGGNLSQYPGINHVRLREFVKMTL
ncbi:MAG: ATP-binding protein [Muribaculaceae bacterium]|nr:ATP-binding protein [Muribaculaceae bacterium]